jgi:hypothetical protein
MKAAKGLLGFLALACVMGAQLRLDCARRRAGLPLASH